MSRVQGMDPDEVRNLAATLYQNAERLETIRADFDGTIRSMRWVGPDSDALRTMWDSTGRRALEEATALLRTAGRGLMGEAAQQEDASASGGAAAEAMAGIGRATPAGGSPAGDGYATLALLHRALDASGYTAVTTGLGFMTVIGTVNKFGHYPQLYKTITRGGEFFKYNKSPSLFNSPLLKALDENPVMKGTGLFGKGLSMVDRGTDIYRAFLDSGHQSTAGEKVEAVGLTVASGLKMSKTPVAYLSGVAVASVTEAVAAGTQVDWSLDGLHDVCAEIKRDPGVVVEELGKATKEVFTKKIWDIL